MATIRVEKDNNFTIIKNNIFLDKRISLKGKGLLTQMLSLPDSWDYTVAGLTTLCKDGRGSITSALKELEAYGYVTRQRIRDEKGLLKDIEYIIREIPLDISESSPISKNPTLENPTLEKPVSEIPISENSQQLSTNLIKDTSNKISNQSILQINDLIKSIKEQINYNELITFDSSLKQKCDELINIIAETLLSDKKSYRINNANVIDVLVKKRFCQLTSADILYVIDALNKTTNPINNIRQYLFTALFNAPATRSLYYSQQAQHDMVEGRCR